MADLKKATIDRWRNEKKAVYWWVGSKFRD